MGSPRTSEETTNDTLQKENDRLRTQRREFLLKLLPARPEEGFNPKDYREVSWEDLRSLVGRDS